MNHISPALDKEIARLFGGKSPEPAATKTVPPSGRAETPRCESSGRPILSLRR